MNLITPVELQQRFSSITHAHRLLLMGSCFADNMGVLLGEHAFQSDTNPFGTLYNPLSVSTALRQIIEGKRYTAADLFLYRTCWHSPMHHGSFSAATPAETLEHINQRLQQAQAVWLSNDWLIITFGTAYVYQDRESEQIVGNCHKQPDSCFTRRLLEVQEVVADYTSLLHQLLASNSALKVLLTVSPIRHVRDGLHANQISKSTLLLAIDQLQAAFPTCVCYFPSYELLMDELRDYRFYADDMLHPSPLAIRYIWERFGETFFSDETRLIAKECTAVRKALAHKPFRPEATEHKQFLEQIVLTIERLNGKYPYLDLHKELELCHIQLTQ